MTYFAQNKKNTRKINDMIAQCWTYTLGTREIRLQCHRFKNDENAYVILYESLNNDAPRPLYMGCFLETELKSIQFGTNGHDVVFLEWEDGQRIDIKI
jgi:hypothetical protein